LTLEAITIFWPDRTFIENTAMESLSLRQPCRVAPNWRTQPRS